MTEEWSGLAQGSPASGTGVSVQRPMAGGQRRHHDLTRVIVGALPWFSELVRRPHGRARHRRNIDQASDIPCMYLFT